jgi:hypothetical protein
VWQSLHGEVDFDDLLVCSALRAVAPDVFFLINQNIEKFRSLSSSSGTDAGRERDNTNRESLRRELEKRSEQAEWDVDTVSRLITFLFPAWEKLRPLQPASSQRVQIGEPTDYWTRLTREQVFATDIRDQDILRAIRSWKKDRSQHVLGEHTLPQAILHVDQFADKVEQFGDSLDGKEVRDIASSLFELIYQEGNVGGGCDRPGFIQLWRLSLGKESDSHDEWVVSQVYQALRINLRFANDIYYFWRHDSEHPGSHAPTPDLRKRIVGLVHHAYQTDPRIYMGALDPAYPWSTYHLVVFHGSPEGGGPGLENEDWRWFASTLMQAWDMEPDLVFPQIVVLLTTGDSKPAERGRVVYEYSFSDSVAERVFGQELMAKLMDKLLTSCEPGEYNPETVARIRCCQAHAQKWKSEYKGTSAVS